MKKHLMNKFKRFFWMVIAFVISAWLAGVAVAEPSSGRKVNPIEMEAFLDGYLAAQMAVQHIAGATVAVVQDGQILLTKGYGLANVAQGIAVDPDKTLFRIASISKLFTWTAVMQLAELGRVDLDTDINRYLDFTIPATFPQPITLNHLMAHTAGFEDLNYQMLALTPEQHPPLNTVLRRNMPARIRPPGQYSSYSNYGTGLAGYIVARESGMSFDDYIEQHILIPLGMNFTTSRQPLPGHLADKMSIGYTFRDGQYQPQPFYFLNNSPAGSFSASATDMARFMLAHLEEGHYEGATILQPATIRQMHTRHFTHDSRLSGLAHGFCEMNMNGQRIIGHGGTLEDFHSILFLIPEHSLGVFLSTNSLGGSVIMTPFLQAFMEYWFPQRLPPLIPPTDFATRGERFSGSFRMNRKSYHTPEKLLALSMPFSIRSDGEGLIVTSPFFSPQYYREVAPLVFRQSDHDNLIIFREDAQGRISHAFYGLLPFLALEKNQWHETPAFNLILLTICFLLFISILVMAPIRFYIRRHLTVQPSEDFWGRLARWWAGLLAILGLLLPLLGMVALEDRIGLLAGNMPLWFLFQIASVLVALLSAGMIAFALLAWQRRIWSLAGRLHYTLFCLGAGGLVWFLYFWNLLGKSF